MFLDELCQFFSVFFKLESDKKRILKKVENNLDFFMCSLVYILNARIKIINSAFLACGVKR